MDGSSDWKLAHGCTAAEGTGPCDDVSGGGLCCFTSFSYSYFIDVH